MTEQPQPAVSLDPALPCGYRRAPDVQARFERAAASLLEFDGWDNPATNRRELVADLALEGGGVKGIALVGAVLVLSEAGYAIRGVAGTSAGAIAASLIAALSAAREPMTRLLECMRTMEFSRFMPEGRLRAFVERHGKVGEFAADGEILLRQMGLFPGTYLEEWLTPLLADLGVTTFGDLALTVDADPGMSLPPGHRYRLVVHTSDITRQQLVRLPWDFPIYGHEDIDREEIVPAVRASMSIPFFFEPVTFHARAATVSVPDPGGGVVEQEYEAGDVTWVDGGMLRNFPIGAFDRVDGAPPRWPTIGIKLSSLQRRFPATTACRHSFDVAMHCLHTMMNEWDAYAVDASSAGRTIFVDNAGLTATEFNLSTQQQDTLFRNGVAAATQFVIQMGEARGVPRKGRS